MIPNQIVIITGATSGIGLATVEVLAAAGYTVVGVGRSQEKIDNLLPILKQKFPQSLIEFWALDIREANTAKTMVNQVVEQHGNLTALINAAGIIQMGATHEVTQDSYDLQFNTLFRGAFFLTVAALPQMIAAGKGLFVNIGSVAGEKASPQMAVYAAAKAALENFTKTIALEYAAKGIRAVCIVPGAVRTSLMDKTIFALIQKKTPLKRLAEPCEIAALIKFLLSEEASYITGSTVAIDGGVGL